MNYYELLGHRQLKNLVSSLVWGEFRSLISEFATALYIYSKTLLKVIKKIKILMS